MRLKGALIAIPSMKMLPMVPRVVMFQYNPETVSRDVTPSFHRKGGANAEVAGFSGAPSEKISLKIQIESIDSKLAILGVRPQIAMLELMAYPSLKQVLANQKLKDQGKTRIDPLEIPTTLFIFGATQVIPVTVSSVGVEEEFFDSFLNPIRATVSLGLEVVPSYNKLLMAYQVQLEALAAVGLASAAASMVL